MLKGLLFSAFLFASTTASAAEAPPIAAYGALPQIAEISLSPSGKLAAFLINRGAQKVLVVRKLEGDKSILQTQTLNDRFGGVEWADDDHLFVITHRTEDTGTFYVHETGFLFLLNLKTGLSKQVAPDGDFSDVGLPELIVHKDGHVYGYLQGDRYLFREDLDSLQVVKVARAGENQGNFILSPDAQIKARMEFRNYGKKWAVLKGEGSGQILASGEAQVGGGIALGLGRTPDTILIADNENGTLDNLREIDLATGKVSESLIDGIDAKPIFDKATRLLIGFYKDGFVEDNVFFDEKLQRRWDAVKAAFPDKHVQFLDTDFAQNRYVVKVEGSHDSGHFYLIDLATRQAIPLGASYPDIHDDQVGAFSWLDYKAADGRPLKTLVTLPPGYTLSTARNLPAVVLPHGGPQARDQFGFDWWGQALASRGYVVIQPEFRGSGGFGREFERAGWGQWGKLMQTDVSDALAAVAAKGIVDPKRACIVGWSYGGYATMAGVTLQNGIYRCAAAGAGVYDLNAMLVWTRDRGGKNGGASRYWKASMALKAESDPASDAISPAKHAAQVTVPVLLLHGRQDTTVPIEQSEEMNAALRAAGKSVEYVILENETHHIESPSTRIKMLEAMTRFLLTQNPIAPN